MEFENCQLPYSSCPTDFFSSKFPDEKKVLHGKFTEFDEFFSSPMIPVEKNGSENCQLPASSCSTKSFSSKFPDEEYIENFVSSPMIPVEKDLPEDMLPDLNIISDDDDYDKDITYRSNNMQILV